MTNDETADGDNARKLIGEMFGSRLGDLDLNGTMDVRDFEMSATHVGTLAPWLDGDLSGEGAVIIGNVTSWSTMSMSFDRHSRMSVVIESI